MERPFIFGYLASKENFIDREEDRKALKNFLGHGINVMLISPRRWGKSSLVKYAMQELMNEDRETKVCFVDAFRVHSEAEFYNAYASAVVNALETTVQKGVELLKKYIQTLSPSITLKSDPLNAIEVELGYKPMQRSAEEILEMPERIAKERNLHVIVCIDEFQQLANLPEWKRMEGLMRSVWQQHQHVNYCLYGSKRHMMMDIFNNSANPFYRFGQVIYLKKIDRKYWIPYIVSQFQKTGKSITEDLAAHICDIVECHSWYVQQLSFFTWSATDDIATGQTVDNALQLLLDTNEPVFEADVDALAPSQVAMLQAIANGEEHLSSRATVARYELGGAQTIAKNKRVLVEKDFVERTGDGFHFVDPLFAIWFRRRYNIQTQ